MAQKTPILYILYNANASATGKLKYAFKKLTSSTDENPTCAACDLTHGGLSLTETPQWVATKKRIQNAEIKQLHMDEIDKEVTDFMESTNTKFPAVLGKASPNDSLHLLFKKDELVGCKKNHEDFLQTLKSRLQSEGIPIIVDDPPSSMKL